MRNVCELLGYKNIKIVQDDELFSFSTDSILLANFATINYDTKEILDLCSGNAAIPLYMTLRTKAKIIGVEISKVSYDMAVESIAMNHMESQIEMLNMDALGIAKYLGTTRFNLITVNPPYFKYKESSIINKNDLKSIARHEVLITLEDIIKEASVLLNNNGILAMVHRPERLVEIILLLEKYGLVMKRLRFVYPKKGREANMVLFEARKTSATSGLKVLEELYVYDSNNHYTEEILKIFNLGG